MSIIAVYIGAGSNMKPINAVIDGKHIQKMLCFDSLPITQFPMMGHINSENTQIDFLDELRNNANDLGFIESKSEPFVFANSKSQEIRYFTNTPFPSGVTINLRQEISKANTLIIAGYHPHKDIIGMMKKPINIICMKNTYYGFKESEKDSIVRKLYKNLSDLTDLSDLSKIVYYYTDTEFKEFKNIAEVEEFNKHRNSLIEILMLWKDLKYKN